MLTNNIEDQLINYTPEMDKINSKYEHKKNGSVAKLKIM
jgi:hypothetical protein